MNIRKNIDYGEMHAALDRAMTAEMGQMKLYCAIGKTVGIHPEKGAAVAASNHLTEHYPDVHGFSPGMSAGCGISTILIKAMRHY